MNVNDFAENILPHFQTEFPILIDYEKSNNDIIVLRAAIAKDETDQFVKLFGQVTCTNWIVYRYGKDLSRLEFSKIWVCQHSSRRKTVSSKRNAMCKSKISITIKKLNEKTKKSDAFLQSSTPLQTELRINLNHSHYTNVADSLRMLRTSDEVRQKFFDYFEDGLTPAVAKRVHENSFIMDDNYITELANSSVNPTRRQIHYFHDQWREINLGPAIHPFEKLKEKCELYKKEGATVELVTEGTWAILIATPVMKRSHTLSSASEIVFIDSTASCESSNSTLTIVLAATKAGAIPLACVIHENQTTESYAKAFKLLKKEFPLCFGGKQAPSVFMTDDSDAEKNALQTVWKSSSQLLCQFHVAQAEWKWIQSSKVIPSDFRPALMKKFQAVMYAGSEEALNTALNELKSSANTYPDYLKRIEAFMLRRGEWTCVDRQVYLTRGHNTNNFAEASVRVLKDIVLCRTKAFNIVALTDFLISVYEKYLTVKLLEFSHNRHVNFKIFTSVMKQVKVTLNECIKVSDNVYLVPSCSKPDQFYEVFLHVGCCSCIRGRTGAFCKHQCFLHQTLNIPFPNAPILNSRERHEFAYIATGEKCPPTSFFHGFTDNEQISDMIPDAYREEQNNGTNTSNIPDTQIKLASQQDKQKLLCEFQRLLHIPHSHSTIQRFTKALAEKKTPQEIASAFTIMSLSLNARRIRERKIKVQPTSICRRKAVYRGSNRVPQGRPSKNKPAAKRSRRPHKLSANIKNNLPHAKKNSTAL